MAEISRGALFGKLNAIAYRGIESATVFCKLRGNPNVELVHWIHQILQAQDSDLHRIVRHFGLNPSNLARDVTAALERLPRGSTTISDLSSEVEEAVERGWVFATLMFGEAQVRTGYLLVGMLRTRHLRHALQAVSAEFGKLRPETLADEFAAIVAGSPEDSLGATDGLRADAVGATGAAGPRRARPAARWRRPRWAASRPCNSSPWISPRRRARAASTRSSAATARSARWSTS